MSAGLASALKAAGFTPRLANALSDSDVVANLEELRTRAWEDDETGRGLRWHLKTIRRFGEKGIAEVEAFRAGHSPEHVERRVHVREHQP